MTRITEKVISQFYSNLVLLLGLPVGRSYDDPVSGIDFGSLFHYPHHCGIGDFKRFISISHSHQPIFTTLGELTDACKRMNPFWKRSSRHQDPDPD